MRDVARLTQQLQGHRLPVEVRARTPICGDDASNDEVLTSAERLLFEPLLQFARRLREIEGTSDLSAFGPVANYFGARTASSEKL